MISARRSTAIAAALFVIAAVFVPALGAGAATGDDLDATRQKLTEARAAANEAAAAFSAADHELEETRLDIGRLQESIATGTSRSWRRPTESSVVS